MALSLMKAVAKVGKPFDLVISDRQMPHMDGTQLGEAISSDPLLKGTSMVMLTSRCVRGDAARMKKIGFSAYLTKPVRRSQLYNCLMMALGTMQNQEVVEDSQLITRHTIADEKRRKIRILVAEDNSINLKLA